MHTLPAGKISNALRCINDCEKGGVVSLTEKSDNKSVPDILKEKHPPASRCDDRYIVEKPANVTPYHPVISDKTQGRVVRSAAMKTHGSHRPSGVDANEWRRWPSNFNQPSTSPCRPCSCVLCLRGCRSTRCQPAMESSISAVVHEEGLS